MRKMLCLVLVMMLLPAAAMAGTVYAPEETEPFAEDAQLLTIRVCPQLGADCMLMTLGEHSMFVDLGVAKSLPLIQKLIEAAGIDRVDYVFNTHPHTDHLGGFQPLVETGFAVGTLITFYPHDYKGQSVIQKAALAAAEEWNVPILDMKTEEKVPFGDADLTAYKVPERRERKSFNCNDLSAMLMIRYGNCSLLWGADVEAEAQGVLADEYDMKADILKIPHHGLSWMNKEFMLEVDPQYVIFTHGSINTTKAQEQLRKNGYVRMRFASWGMITIQTDGEKWIVSQEIDPDVQKYTERFLKNNPWIRQ